MTTSVITIFSRRRLLHGVITLNYLMIETSQVITAVKMLMSQRHVYIDVSEEHTASVFRAGFVTCFGVVPAFERNIMVWPPDRAMVFRVIK